MSQGTAELFDFLFVRSFLALCEFKGFEDFFHVIERFAKRFDNAIDILDGILNRGRRSSVRRESVGRRG